MYINICIYIHIMDVSKRAFSTLMRRRERVYGDCAHTFHICVYICVRMQIDVMYISMYGCIKRGVFNVDEAEGTGLWRLHTYCSNMCIHMCTYTHRCNVYINVWMHKKGRFQRWWGGRHGFMAIAQTLWIRHSYPRCEHICEYANTRIYVYIYKHIYMYMCVYKHMCINMF